jgi:excisionase family DNA binding protein
MKQLRGQGDCNEPTLRRQGRSAAAAARQLAISPWTIRLYIRQGKLRPVRIGRLVCLDEEELSRFVADSKSDNGPSIQIQSGEQQ